MTLEEKLKKRAVELVKILPADDVKFEEIVTLNKDGNTIYTKNITLARVVNLLEEGWCALPF